MITFYFVTKRCARKMKKLAIFANYNSFSFFVSYFDRGCYDSSFVQSYFTTFREKGLLVGI